MPKRILVLSDTHNNQKLLRIPFEHESDIDYVFHLGDRFEDLDENLDLLQDRIVIKVPGANHPYYFHPRYPTIKTISILDWQFSIGHVKQDLIKKNDQSDFYLFGHTHQPTIFQQNKICYVNPGHLKRSMDRGFEPTYATIELNNTTANIKIFDLKGNLFKGSTLYK